MWCQRRRRSSASTGVIPLVVGMGVEVGECEESGWRGEKRRAGSRWRPRDWAMRRRRPVRG